MIQGNKESPTSLVATLQVKSGIRDQNAGTRNKFMRTRVFQSAPRFAWAGDMVMGQQMCSSCLTKEEEEEEEEKKKKKDARANR